MSFALAITIDRMAVTRVVLSTRRYSRPLAFIRGLTSSPKIYVWIWDPREPFDTPFPCYPAPLG